jgi:GT2 family glycosyltransferase
VQVLQCPEDLGLANAYNLGIQLAQRSGITWLLTLDQDAKLPETFLAGMADHVRRHQHDPSIAAILPRVQGGSIPLSPFFYRWQARPTWFAKSYVGIPDQPVFGNNSVSMLRVDALVQAGGYDPLFWLDCIDVAIFSRLHRFGKRVLVADDVEVQHELSLKDMQHYQSPERYRHMLLAESAFWDAEMGVLARLERTVRLAVRLLQQIIRRAPPAPRSLLCRLF